MRDDLAVLIKELEQASDKFDESKRHLEREARKAEKITASRVLKTEGTLTLSGRRLRTGFGLPWNAPVHPQLTNLNINSLMCSLILNRGSRLNRMLGSVSAHKPTHTSLVRASNANEC